MNEHDILLQLIYALVYDATFFKLEAGRNHAEWMKHRDPERYNAGWIQDRIADDHYTWLEGSLSAYLAEAHARRQNRDGGCGGAQGMCVFCEMEAQR